MNIAFLLSASFLISLVTTLTLEQLCARFSIYDHPGERKLQKKPIPRLGGMAFVLTSGVLLFTQTELPLYFSLASSLVYLGGLFDDIKNANAVVLKLIFQIPAAAIFAVFFDLNGFHISFVISILIRVLIFAFLFFMTNAANLMDNMNGLAAGLNMLILLGLSGLASFSGQPQYAPAALIVCAAVGGFLTRNYPRAKIFMGDQGSQFLGFFSVGLALLIVAKMPVFDAHSIGNIAFIALGLAIMFGAFFYDVITVVRIRLREKRSPFRGDLCHVSHRLTDRGWTATQAVAILYLVQCILTFVSFELLHISS